MASSSNTPSMYFLDSESKTKDCAKDIKELEKHCAPDEKNKQNRGKGKPKARANHKEKDKDASWVMDHCGPLLMKPGEDFDEWNKIDFKKQVNDQLGAVATELQSKVIDKIEKEILEYGVKAAGKLAIRRGLTGWIPVVGWVMTVVDVATTAIDIANKVSDMKKVVSDLKNTVQELQKHSQKITDTYAKYKDKLANFNTLSKDKQDEIAREIMVDVQAGYGIVNSCMRARKCLLVPYNQGAAGKWQGKGCCPGQTGHHLLPDAMFRDPVESQKKKDEWANNPKSIDKNGKRRSLDRNMLPKKKLLGQLFCRRSPDHLRRGSKSACWLAWNAAYDYQRTSQSVG